VRGERTVLLPGCKHVKLPILKVVAVAAGLMWAPMIPAADPADEAQPRAKTDPVDALFGLDKLHELHLTMSTEEWAAMQPAGPRGIPGFAGMPRQQRPADQRMRKDRPTHSGNMLEYPVAYGHLEVHGTTYRNIAVRYKGNFTYMASAHALKRSLKFDFEGAGENALEFYGMRKLNLHAGVLDPTRQREALSYEVFRAAGVPAPRTAFAELTLTVPGKYDRECVGLYVAVEQVDKRFLEKWFTDSKGLLCKPQGVRGPEYLGERWENYDSQYRPNRAPSRDEAQRVIAFANLVTNANDEQFRHQIDSFLDVGQFLRFLAASAMLVNLDGPLAMPQNFYLYLDPKTQRFVFLPWDLDLSLAAWPMGGMPEQQMDLSLMHPHAGQHKLIDRLLALPTVRERYKAILRELAGDAFAKARLLDNIDIIERTTKSSLVKEAIAIKARQESVGGLSSIAARAPLPRLFVERRVESIQAQLSGARQGYIPTIAFGPPGRPPGPGAPRPPLSARP
jgi:spore coat protein H